MLGSKVALRLARRCLVWSALYRGVLVDIDMSGGFGKCLELAVYKREGDL